MIAPMLGSVLGIAAGGGLGAVCRYGVVALGAQLGWPHWGAILMANGVGCTLMGAILGWHHRAGESGLPLWWSPVLESAVIIGFLGALTTFSSFSGDIFKLLQAQQLGLLAGYVVASVLGGFACLVLAYRWVANFPLS